jgi:hypothetical protein
VKRGVVPYRLITWSLLFGHLLSACTQNSASLTPTPFLIQRQRDTKVPDLPFPDNPDPTLCGIPVKWGLGSPAWLRGYYQGDLIEPTVYLYDSHLRDKIAGKAPSGTAVQILLYQHNPELDYYMVETIGVSPKQTGWVPAPFISLQK